LFFGASDLLFITIMNGQLIINGRRAQTQSNAVRGLAPAGFWDEQISVKNKQKKIDVKNMCCPMKISDIFFLDHPHHPQSKLAGLVAGKQVSYRNSPQRLSGNVIDSRSERFRFVPNDIAIFGLGHLCATGSFSSMDSLSTVYQLCGFARTTASHASDGACRTDIQSR
jgi:hypothetical protein